MGNNPNVKHKTIKLLKENRKIWGNLKIVEEFLGTK